VEEGGNEKKKSIRGDRHYWAGTYRTQPGFRKKVREAEQRGGFDTEVKLKTVGGPTSTVRGKERKN